MNMVHTELDDYFVYKCEKGLKARGLADREEYVQRLAYETEVIIRMGFPGYFIIVQDFINWARSQNIYVGPGRGSGAGSLCCYSLGITDLDPIHWDLLFERFLNPDRISMPDLDIDFEKRYRDRVIQYVMDKYGHDHTAHIGTFGKMRAKNAVKTACRLLDEPIAIGEKLSKLLLGTLHGKPRPLADSIAEVKELQNAIEHNPNEAAILTLAQQLEDRIFSIGVHASGIVVSNNKLTDTIPLYRGKNGEVVTQLDMNHVEDVGLIKFDFLGLDALDKIHRCIDIVNQRYDKKISISDIDPTDPDPQVFEDLRKGSSVGIFQLEASTGIRDLLVQIRPTNVEDLVALVAIYRPGPLANDYLQTYLSIRAGIDKPEYLIPELEPILKRTYGWLIFQEQAMEIAKKLCGYTGGQADELRKAIGKKKQALMDKHESMFKEGWIKNGLPAPEVEELWTQICAFASYSFNRSHAAAYAVITYYTAWLKTHYPREFMCAVMICESGKQDDMIKCLAECKRLGIDVLPPDINESSSEFQLNSKGAIRFGLGPIKNVGASVSAIIEAREVGGQFKSLGDFCERVDTGQITSLKISSLIRAGAFDRFGKTRATLLVELEALWEHRTKMKSYENKLNTYTKRIAEYEQRLIDIKNDVRSPKGNKLKPLTLPEKPEYPELPKIPDLEELPNTEIWTTEHDLLGSFVSSHPMDGVRDRIKNRSKFNTIEEIKELQVGLRVSVPAVITKVQEITTKTKKKMAFVTIEDLTGSIEVTMFASTFNQMGHLLAEKGPLCFSGIVDVAEGDEGRVTKLIVKSLAYLDLYEPPKPTKIKTQVGVKVATRLARFIKEIEGNVHEIDMVVILGDGTEVVLSDNPRIKDCKGTFNRALGRIRNE